MHAFMYACMHENMDESVAQENIFLTLCLLREIERGMTSKLTTTQKKSIK
jgi:hypothetical protein